MQAYPSLVVALDLPLPLREQSSKDLLQECGFEAEAILEIIAEGLDLSEWGGVYTPQASHRGFPGVRVDGSRLLGRRSHVYGRCGGRIATGRHNCSCDPIEGDETYSTDAS